MPDELTEAARVDGARRAAGVPPVTLPLLLVARAPLLIASFAFNFNNFNNIYMLTGGGPSETTSRSRAHRHPDQLHVQGRVRAAEAGTTALAAAVSIFIFFIVAGISARLVLAHQGTGERSMSDPRSEREVDRHGAGRRVRPRREAPGAGPVRRHWWRHLVGLARDRLRDLPGRCTSSRRPSTRIDSLTGSSLIPREHHARQLPARSCAEPRASRRSAEDGLDVPYTSWYINSLFIVRCDGACCHGVPRRARRLRVLRASASRAAGSGCCSCS